MRFAIVAIAAAGFMITPAVAQENEANTAVAINATENVTGNVAAEPALPLNAPVTSAPVTEPATQPAPAPVRERGGGFPWGLVGLIGLVGLLGRARS